jgi:hypothetical protein
VEREPFTPLVRVCSFNQSTSSSFNWLSRKFFGPADPECYNIHKHRQLLYLARWSTGAGRLDARSEGSVEQRARGRIGTVICSASSFSSWKTAIYLCANHAQTHPPGTWAQGVGLLLPLNPGDGETSRGAMNNLESLVHTIILRKTSL